jgi:transcriptional regulator with XRE-family HTH domain
MPANAALTGTAARELGKALRFIRQARGLSLRDVAQQAPISPQYLQNIERGERLAASLDVYGRLQRDYELPEGALPDLILKFRVLSALEERGVSPQHAHTVWDSVESQLNSLRYPVRTDLAELVAAVINAR